MPHHDHDGSAALAADPRDRELEAPAVRRLPIHDQNQIVRQHARRFGGRAAEDAANRDAFRLEVDSRADPLEDPGDVLAVEPEILRLQVGRVRIVERGDDSVDRRGAEAV